MADKIIISGARLQAYGKPGSMGVVTDTHYKNCHWPKLDQPTALFAEGSSGLVIEGPPTPRNVLFPPDTVFAEGTRGDCFFLRHTESVLLPNGKNRFDDYVAELTAKEAADIHEGKADVGEFKAVKEFVAIQDSPLDQNAKRYEVKGDAIAEKVIEVAVIEDVVLK